AGFIGAPTVVIVSISAIFAFVITPITEVISMLRILLLIPTVVFGIFGITVGALVAITHMVSITSMGAPYMAPMSPTYFADWKDFIIRGPLQWFQNRPRSIPNRKKRRLRNAPRKW
ncbi:MAG TPA: spore germination protein, partial [Bacilli bacterium]